MRSAVPAIQSTSLHHSSTLALLTHVCHCSGGRYGEHLSKEQVAELIAPPSDVPSLVNAWLEHHGVLPSTVLTKHGGSRLVLMGVPVSRANDLLGASYQLYQHSETNMTVLRTLSYGLPEALREHVQTVMPTTHFGFPRTSRQKPHLRSGGAREAHAKVPAGELEAALSSRQIPIARVTPDFLRWLYRTSAYVPTAPDFNVIGIAGFQYEYPSPTDLMQFMRQFRADATYATYSVALVNGGAYNPNNPAQEPNLDIQFSLGIAYPTRLIFYSTSESPDALVAWLDYVLDQLLVPQTISCSYGLPEYQVPPDYAVHACNLFAQIAVRGGSVLASSGDDGVGDGNCLFQDNSGNLFVRFRATFPSTCTCSISLCLNAIHNPQLTTLATLSKVPGSPALVQPQATTRR